MCSPVCCYALLFVIIGYLLVTLGSATPVDTIRLPFHISNPSKEHISPLYGDFSQLFMYYTNIYVGTPPIKFTVTIDTGSSDLLIPSVICSDCQGGNPALYYNISNSLTGKPISCQTKLNCTACIEDQCSYSISYAGGASLTVESLVVNDIVSISNLTSFVTFGTIFNVSMQNQEQMTKNYFTQSSYPEGILGIGFAGMNSLGTTPFLDHIINNYDLPNMFSICINEFKSGGTLIIGGIEHNYFYGDLQYTPIITPYYYSIHIEHFSVNDQILNVSQYVWNDCKSIVDTGTPMPTIPTQAFDLLKKGLLQNCSANYLIGVCDKKSNETILDGFCYNLTQQEKNQYPTFTWTLKNNVILHYHPKDYLQYTYNCASPDLVGMWLEADGTGFAVLGAKLLQQFYTVYDKGDLKMGFAEVKDCPSNL